MNAAIALLLAVCLSSVSSVALALVYGRISFTIALISLAIGALGAIIWIRRRSRSDARQPLSLLDWTFALLFALFSLRAFCWLIFTDGDALRVLSPNNLGDMSLHLTYIRYLAKGATFWPDNPIFSGLKLHYPLGIDVFNALLAVVGVDVYRGLDLGRSGWLLCYLRDALPVGKMVWYCRISFQWGGCWVCGLKNRPFS